MKQRNVLRVFCVLFGFIAVLSLLIQFLVKPAQLVDITKNFEYTAAEATALPDDVPETIEQDGQTYTRVDYTEAQPVINVVSEDKRYSETVTIEDLPSEQAPETKEFEVNGQTVTLTLESADYTAVTKPYNATGEVRYDNQTSRPDAPEHSEITYENEAGNKITVEGTLQSVERVDDGSSVRNITSTIELPAGATIFVVNGKYVAYNPETPLWDGYQQDVLEGAQLDPNLYTVTGGYWSSDPYYEGNVMMRDITWTIQAPASSYVATYTASGENTTYTATAVYSAGIEELGLDESLANDTEYSLSTDITYRLNEVVSDNPLVQIMSSNALVVPAVAVVSGILFLICLFALIFIAKTKSSTWVHDEAYGDDPDYDNGNYDSASYNNGGYNNGGYQDDDGDDFSTSI